MDKAAIERFAIASRIKLRNSVSLKMTDLGANPEYPMKVDVVGSYVVLTDPNNGIERRLTSDEAKARDSLLQAVSGNGFDSVVESVAYTWFNRLIAVRYMEVNNYLPSHVRVLSSISPGKKEPDLVTHCLSSNINLTSSEKETVIKYQNQGRFDDLFKIMFLAQCRDLNALLPELFTRTNSYENLLFDISYTNPDGVIRDLVDNIPEDDFKDAVQIIGWMYQYYNTELKNDTFTQLKKNIKISKDRIPSATQLFTPDWIVRYMVENSVGRIWLDGHPDELLESNWKYYLDEADQITDVQEKLSEIHKDRSKLSPEDITVIDPCMGSGHILVYAFDVLMQIYESYGYSKEDAALLIVEKNLYGLDIDDRAYQLAYFAVMMKVRQYNHKALNSNISSNLFSIPDSTFIDDSILCNYSNDLNDFEKNIALNDLKYLIDVFKQGKNIGSLLKLKVVDNDLIERFLKGCITNLYSNASTQDMLKKIMSTARILSNKYDVVITNPPYMGSSGMNNTVLEYVKCNYPDSKSDLSTCFMERAFLFSNNVGYISLINIPVWMFLTSYEDLRKKILLEKLIVNMVHPGRGVFGSDFGSTSFCLCNYHVDNYVSTFCKLYNKQGEVNSNEYLESIFLSGINRFYRSANDFLAIPLEPIAYWVCNSIFDVFKNSVPLGQLVPVKKGMDTSNNSYFLRFWYEVDWNKVDLFSNKGRYWIPYDKGGDYRKWYGNNDYILKWGGDGSELEKSSANLRSKHLYFKESITWNALSASLTCFRYSPFKGSFDSAGSSLFPDNIYFYLGILNSPSIQYILNLINPTLNYGAGTISLIPIMDFEDSIDRISTLAKENVVNMRWICNNLETSYEFKDNVLISRHLCLVQQCVDSVIAEYNDRINQLSNNDQLLSDIVNSKYRIVPITNDLYKQYAFSPSIKDLIKNLISYSVGCIFGRYSLDVQGLCCTGPLLNSSLYSSFIPDMDNIVPINDEEYFGDDIVTYFCNFIETTFGSENLESNLKYIASSLEIKGSGTAREKIRKYFLNDFYKDHLQMYQKCPIYWLFDSGKANGFKALVYVHRYTPDLIGRMRKEYLHRIQRLYNDQMSVESDQVRRTSLQKKLDEISRYDLAVELYALKNIEIDLDDGIKHNYALFQNIENSKAANDKINLLYKI